MSIGNVHMFNKLTKDSKALAEQRLVRLIAKGANKSENLAESLCVSVPITQASELAGHIERLMPHIVGMVKDAQDKMIREYRIKTGAAGVAENEFSVDAVIAWLDANTAGDRVSSEYLEQWFMSDYADAARAWITAKLGGAVAEDVLNAKVNVVKGMFAGFSSNKYSPSIPQLRAMIDFIGTLDDGDIDARMTGYGEKCVDMLARKESELSIDALGFA